MPLKEKHERKAIGKIAKEFQLENASKKPECKHFSECLGCRIMNLSYEKQLELKELILQELFNKVNGIWKGKIKVMPSKEKLRYRNKADFAFQNRKLGYYKIDDLNDCFELEDCKVLSKQVNKTLKKLQSLLAREQVRSFSKKTREGFFRNVVIRESKASKEQLVNLVVWQKGNEREMKSSEKIASELLKEKNVSGVAVIENKSLKQVPYGKVLRVFGKKEIKENFLGFEFAIGFQTFFQTNPKIAEKIFEKVAKESKGKVLELYSGVGAISLPVVRSKQVKEVVGIEENKEAVSFADKNAKFNEIENASFVCGNVEKVLAKNAGKWLGKFDTVIVDPPRKGMGFKTVQKILSLKPERIIYVSCNPFTMKKDLQVILGNENLGSEKSKEKIKGKLKKKQEKIKGSFGMFELKKLEAFDNFPQTQHIECKAVLERQVRK